jgi:hypothetical protein
MPSNKRSGKSPAVAPQRTLQTTLRLPDALYLKARKIVADRKHADNMNQLIITALSAYLNALDRKAIDLAFAGMADDAEYLLESQLVAQQFAESDAEADRIAAKQFSRQR